MRAAALHRDATLAALSIAILAVIGSHAAEFVRPAGLAAIFDDTAILIVLALGQMAVLLTRGVDLSIAANVALTGMIAAMLDTAHPDLGAGPILLVAALCGAGLGACNGWLVWRLQVPPIVATLATMAVFRGAVFLLSGGQWLTSTTMSPAFIGFVRMHWLGLSLPAWCAIAAVVAAAVLLNRTRFGRRIFAAGSNPQAAHYAGIDVGRVQFLAFTLSGLLGGICGDLWVAKYAIAYSDVAMGFELQVIAACVIGGVSINGGGGTIRGVVLGALLLGVIKNALPLLGISPFWQMAVSGLVIVIAVILGTRNAREGRRTILEGSRA